MGWDEWMVGILLGENEMEIEIRVGKFGAAAIGFAAVFYVEIKINTYTRRRRRRRRPIPNNDDEESLSFPACNLKLFPIRFLFFPPRDSASLDEWRTGNEL